MRTALAAAVLSAAGMFVSGCTASDGTDASSEDVVESSEDALSGAAVKNVSVVDLSVAVGDTVDVPYAPATDYFTGEAVEGPVPYLAVALPADAAGKAAITVEGNFPGTPAVLVTDSKFRVLSRGTSLAGLQGAINDQTSVKVPQTRGPKFVLIRDQLWTKPMTFKVTVAR